LEVTVRLEKGWVDPNQLGLEDERLKQRLEAVLHYLILSKAIDDLECVTFEGGITGRALRLERERWVAKLPDAFLEDDRPTGIFHAPRDGNAIYIHAYGEVAGELYVVFLFYVDAAMPNEHRYYVPYQLTGETDVDMRPLRVDRRGMIVAIVDVRVDDVYPSVEDVVRVAYNR
jgi:hypothetical protein